MFPKTTWPMTLPAMNSLLPFANMQLRKVPEVFVICAQIEQEIAELDDDEKKMFLEDLGLSESGLEKLIKASYRLLGLISYLTAGRPNPVHGPLKTVPRHLRLPERFIPV